MESDHCPPMSFCKNSLHGKNLNGAPSYYKTLPEIVVELFFFHQVNNLHVTFNKKKHFF